MKRVFINCLGILLLAALASNSAGVPEFLVIKSENVEIHYQPGVTPEQAKQCEANFNVSYSLVGKDLGYAARTVTIYIYTNTNELLNDIITRFGYNAKFFRTTQATPRMSSDYVMWALPSRKIDFLTHEYTHRIIEQLAGINAQVSFKWFDEGLADYMGNRALALADPKLARCKIEQEEKYLASQYEQGALLKLKQITDETQWSDRMMQGQSRLIYAEAARVTAWLIENSGIEKAKSILERMGKRADFSSAFQQVYGFTPAELERCYLEYLRGINTTLKQQRASLRFNFTLDDDPWQQVRPLTDDGRDPLKVPEADIRSVYAETSGSAFYLLLTTESRSNQNPDVSYCVYLDGNNDDKADYQIGFKTDDAWLWELKGAGNSDPSNLQSHICHESFFGRTIKFMLPLPLLKIDSQPRLQLYTFYKGKAANPRKSWIQVIQNS